MKSKALKQSLKIAIPYLIFGCVYIAFSDIMVKTISLNRAMLTELQTYKGWGFIVLTTLLLFVLLRRHFSKLEKEQKNLEESEARWRTLVSSSPDFIAMLDKESRFLYLNKYADGFSEEKVIGQNCADFIDIKFRSNYLEIFKTCLETKTTQRFEFEGDGNNKSKRYYEEYLVPLISKDKEITFLAIARDITDRKNFETALKESEEKYRALIENTQEAIYIAQDGKIKYVNRSAKNITGRTESELLEHNITEFVPAEDYDFAIEHHRQLISGETTEIQSEFCIINKKGSVIDLLVNSVLIIWEERPATLNFASDITERKQFEKVLLESENQLQLAQSIGKIGNWYYDIETEYFSLSDEMYRIFERDKSEGPITFEDGLKFILPEDIPEVTEFFEHSLTTGEGWDRDLRMILPSGRLVWHRSIGQTVKNDFDKVVKIYGISQDITERKNIENILKESEEKYRTLFENMSEGFAFCKMIFDDGKPVDFIFLITNPRFGYLTGIKNEDGKKVSELIPGIRETNPEIFEIYGRVSLGGKPETFETYVPGLNDWFLVSVYSPKPEHFVAVFSIVTERKQTELALQKNRRFLADLIENSGTLIYVKDIEGRYELVNKKWESITGINRNNVLGKTDEVLFPGGDGSQFHKNDNDVVENRKVIETEEVLNGGDKKRYFISIKFPTLDEYGEVSGICGMSTEVTERKFAEDALRESEERFRSIVEGAPDAIFIQVESKFAFLNPAAYTLLGYDNPEEIIGTKIIDHIHPDYRLNVSDRIKRLNIERLPIVELTEQIFLKKDGSQVWVETKGEPITYEGKNGALVFVRDISQRRKAENALRESEAKYRTITESMKDVVWILDINTEHFTYISPSVIKLRGYTPEEIMAENVNAALTQDSFESLREITLQRTNEFLSNKGEIKYYTDQVEQPCKDGSTVWTEVVTNYHFNEQTGHLEVHGVTRDLTKRKKIQDALIKSEERFRSTLDNMLEGCQILDSELKYIYINDAAEKHNHKPKNEMLGKKYIDLWPGIEETYVFRTIKKCLEKKESYQYENEFTYPDGTIGWFDLSIQPVPEGVFILSVDITQRKKVENEILNSREQLRALAASLEKLKEEERIHLSRELHDHLGQNLTGLKMDVAYLAKHFQKDKTIDRKSVIEKATGMSDLIDDLIKNVRKISSELRPNVLDYLGLIPAIEWQIEEFKKRTEIDCIYESNTSKIDLGMQINSSVFRIIQEAFTNVIRHAKATEVKFSINEQHDKITIKILDNGIGINTDEISNLRSLGILGMKERTINFNGSLNIENSSVGGTLLTLIIPKQVNND
ncbi:MAG: PAS domain S-box protein [Ignavibacteriaceae bacterium]